MFKFKFLGIDWDFTFIRTTLLCVLLFSYSVLLPLGTLVGVLYGLLNDNYYITAICVFLGCLFYASWDSVEEKFKGIEIE